MNNITIDGDLRIYRFGFEVYPIAFRIYYGDDTTYTGIGNQSELKKLWEEAPNENIQVITLFENTPNGLGGNTKMFYSGVDYYMFDGEKFVFDNIIHDGHVLYGKWDSNEHYTALRQRALSENL